MCELFGITGTKEITANAYLKEFFSHSRKHPNGWGIAVFQGNEVRLEKEPIEASKSLYLKERLRRPLIVENMFAHIRFATRGQMEYCNSHPFVEKDRTGRTWTLIHNGTIFHCPAFNPYVFTQSGQTDSERILLYVIDEINKQTEVNGGMLNSSQRFSVIDRIQQEITPQNKVNLLLYDGELMYVHINYKDSLYKKQDGNSLILSTQPLDRGAWEPIPLNCPEGYCNGQLLYTGTNHGNEYFEKPEDMKHLFLDYSGL